MNLELGFNEMEYDTTKARKLFQEYQEFVGCNFEETGEFVRDSVGNKICLSGSIKSHKQISEDVVITKKLWRLSQLIEENIELFCQLEYMIRKIQPAELKAYDLKLIVQNLIYASDNFRTNFTSTRPYSSYQGVCMLDDSPLVSLAHVAQNVLANEPIWIISEKQTAVVCWLFAELCKKAGFTEDKVFLSFQDVYTPVSKELNLKHIEELTYGCIAVVTAKSDIDSAVDVLVETPDRFPWSVKRILVQESAVQRFRISLEMKAKRNPGSEVDEALSRKCTSAFTCEGKTFLFEFAGDDTALAGSGGTIVVEAYRTVKELLSLLSNFKPYALSVWCDSVAENLEIAHNVSSNIVWVNSFGDFDGPSETSQSFFSIINAFSSFEIPGFLREATKFKEVSKLWANLSAFERATKLKDLLILHNVRVTDDSFYYVSGKYICAGTEKPAGALVLGKHTVFSVSELLSFAIKGGCLIISENGEFSKPLLELIDSLESVGVPVGRRINVPDDEAMNSNYVSYNTIVYRKKVVWTSYGTIFSN